MRALLQSSFVLLFLFTLTGCTSEYNLATQQEESLIYGTEKEVQIGESVAHAIENHYKDKIVTEVDVNERVEKILKRIVAVSDRSDLVFFIKVIDEDVMNAVSLPGGFIYVFKGLTDKVDNDDQLAGVIAHEVGHVMAKHAIKHIQAAYGALILQVATAVSPARNITGGVGLAMNSLFMEYSQQDEFQADALGVKYMKKAGYKPEEMLKVLEKLRAQQQKEPIREFSYWRTHPYLMERMGKVNTEISGKMDFRDYVRTIGRED